MQQEDLYFRLLTLVPNARFNFRLYDPELVHLCLNPVRVGEWLIDWSSENVVNCPTLEELNAIPNFDAADFQEKARKTDRNKNLAGDLSIVALYNLAKVTSPNLIFSDYLDVLEEEKES